MLLNLLIYIADKGYNSDICEQYDTFFSLFSYLPAYCNYFNSSI